MIRQYLQDHYNINRLYGSYLVNTDRIDNAFEEVQEFIHNNILTEGKLEKNPDYLCISKVNNTTRNISVDQIRGMQAFLYKTSVISGKKIAIIYAADQMNLNAANSCLKVLEDTPANTYLFLLTENAASILPTIRSRCVKINHHYDSSQHTLEEKFLKPLLKTTYATEKLDFIKEFASKDHNLWDDFSTTMESLIAKFCSAIVRKNKVLSDLEQKLFEQLKSHSLEYLQTKYDEVKELINNTNNFDLDLRASCLLLIEKFRK